MAQIKVIQPGLLTTLQDAGRSKYQHLGMPVAGAMDLYALQLANYLVDNPRYEACLEMTIFGSILEFQTDTRIAITGGFPQISVNGQKKKSYRTLKIKSGDVLEIGQVEMGARCYLAVAGGFDVPVVMGSKSTYLNGKIGGFEGRPLGAEDILPIFDLDRKIKKRKIKKQHIPLWEEETEIRFVSGPEKDKLNMEGIKTFLTTPYTVSSSSDRMGFRLNGEPLKHTDENIDIISSAIMFGTIQVPKYGLPIIMMADHQTTGGYARVANVISADFHKLAQLKPGDKIYFKEVDLAMAHKVLKYHNDVIDKYFDQ